MNNALHGPHAYRIPTENLDSFNKKFARLVKAAARCGVPEPRMADLGAYERTVQVVEQIDPFSEGAAFGGAVTTRRVTGRLIAVSAERAQIPGWALIARIDHIGPEGNIVARIDGNAGDLHLHQATPDCVHCGLARTRKVTYIVRDEAGTDKQVGSTCLVDFTGHINAEHAADYAQLLSELVVGGEDDEEGSERRGVQVWAFETILAVAADVIQAMGYRSRSKCAPGESSTADLVALLLGNPTAKDARELAKQVEAKANAKHSAVQVAAAMTFVQGLAAADRVRSDYEMNLVSLYRANYVPARFFGYVVSALGAAEREAVKRRQTAEFKPGFVGEVGKRVTVRLKLVSTMELSSAYGITVLHRFIDADGHQVVWMGSDYAKVQRNVTVDHPQPGRDFIKKGAWHWMVCTVKDHGQFRGQDQTKVSRLEVVKATWVKAEAAKAARKAERAAKKAAKAVKVDATPTT